MLNRKQLLAALILLLLWTAVPGGAGIAMGSEDERPRPEAWVRAPVLQAGTESASGMVPDLIPVKRERDPLIEELHRARRAGDHLTVERITTGLQRPAPTGESAGGTVRMPSDTIFVKGDYPEQKDGMSQGSAAGGMQKSTFGSDRLVRWYNSVLPEWDQTVVCDSQGVLYVGFLIDDPLTLLQIYTSQDGGVTWEPFGHVVSPMGDIRDPCLAVGEGTENKLLAAYVVDYSFGMNFPEVATIDLDGGTSFDIHSLPVSNWEAYAKPVIWTDAVNFNGWYAYLTCEGIFDSAANNINVCAWKSESYGASWGSQNVVLGNTDQQAWTDPDGTYGTYLNNVYIACYNDTDDTIYLLESSDYGNTYGAAQALYTMSQEPNHPVDPEIAAAVNHDHIMLCCTACFGSDDHIGQGYSTDAGATWSVLWPMDGYTALDEFAPVLTANQGGASWHLAYTSDNHVFYSRRPQDLSAYWQYTPDVVDDAHAASNAYPKKGIASNWTTDAAGIAWADFRDGVPDYDTYFDFAGNSSIYRVPSQYSTIQKAIDAAPEGGIVQVARGHYPENINFNGKAILVVSKAGAHFTWIDGKASGPVVTFDSGEGAESRLKGFTLTNGSAANGGGVLCMDSDPCLTNCVIAFNEADRGAGVYCNNSFPYLLNCTIAANTAAVEGGGLHSTNSAHPVLQNSILYDNTAPSGPQIFVSPKGKNDPVVSYCDVEGGWPGKGNIDAKPHFASAVLTDFHLLYVSPCRDAGSNGAAGLPEDDFEGDPRIDGGTVDMGADEFHPHLYYTGVAEPGKTINLTLIGPPSSAQTGFWISTGLLDVPATGGYGKWWLLPPLIGPITLGPMPYNGMLVLQGALPSSVPGPYEFHVQGIMGPPYELTNYCTVQVE